MYTSKPELSKDICFPPQKNLSCETRHNALYH